MTSEALATVDRLSSRLGVALVADTPDYARAEEALWSASVQAKAVAQQPNWTSDSAPEGVVDVVLSAAARTFKNPDRNVSNQAGTFQATLAQSDFATGLFLSGELAVLHRHRPDVLTVVTAYRDDDAEFDPRADPANYTPAPVDGVSGDPLFGWSGQFDH
uniref:hypothetical protein n=1 Tax=Gordonia sp. B7-2 TaxID=3420932 RepID=UPI003D8B05C5